jgi:signal transduction histidine kinase
LKVTVQKLAHSNETVASIQNALAHSEKLAHMGQLAAGVAHEVNNPLGVVLMYSHLLLEKYGEDSVLRDDLKMIAQQADRCKRIISGLLNFARENKTICQPTDIAELVHETLLSVAFHSSVQVKVIDLMHDRVAEIDPDQITQALINLLTNAEAAMPEGGELRIEISDTDESIQLKVSDTGTGISQENIGRIFDPFFTTKQIGKGTGLGLAVLYGIVKMHHGTVTVHSNANATKGPTGTTFTMKLPRKDG